MPLFIHFGKKYDEVIFLINARSLNAEKINPSTIGEIYLEASDEFHRAFGTTSPTITKPIEDKWGKTVSVLSPINIGRRKLILAIDIDVDDWIFIHLRNMIFPFNNSFVSNDCNILPFIQTV